MFSPKKLISHPSKIIVLLLLIFAVCVKVFAVKTFEDYFTAFNDFATDAGGNMAFMGGMGLAWSDPYIGYLINPLPHWGFGLTLGAITQSNANLGKLSEGIGVTWDPVISGKQLQMLYTAEVRLGGFRTVPFDLGVKFGLLPTGILSIAQGMGFYQMQLIGADFRWCLNKGYSMAPKMSVGLEFNMVSGGYVFNPEAFSVAEAVSSSGAAQRGRIFSGEGSTLSYLWSGQVIDLKIDVSKRFPVSGFTFFGGGKVGIAISNVSWVLTGTGVGFGTSQSTANQLTGTAFNTDDKRAAKAAEIEALLPAGTVTITPTDITILYPGTAIDIQGHLGLSFDLDRIRLSFSYMMDILHFESGFALQVRYQQ